LVINFKKIKEIMKMFNKSRMAWTISALFLVAVTSCSKDEPVEQSPSPSAGQILFTGEQAGLTVKSALIDNNSDFVAVAGSTLKTTLHGYETWWTATSDRVGIYSEEARTAATAGSRVVNNLYTANITAASTPFTAVPTMYWGAASSPHTFYAYYPYSNAPVPNPEAAAVPIGLLSTQVQSAANDYTHIGALDFLVAAPITVDSPAAAGVTTHPTVHLVYNHVFTIVEFNITGTSGSLNGIRLSGTSLALEGALINIKQTTPPAGSPYTLADPGTISGAVIVNLTAAAALSATPFKVYMVIYPGFAGTTSIQFTKDGGTIWKNAVNPALEAPTGGFKRGQYYTVSVDAGAL